MCIRCTYSHARACLLCAGMFSIFISSWIGATAKIYVESGRLKLELKLNYLYCCSNLFEILVLQISLVRSIRTTKKRTVKLNHFLHPNTSKNSLCWSFAWHVSPTGLPSLAWRPCKWHIKLLSRGLLKPRLLKQTLRKYGNICNWLFPQSVFRSQIPSRTLSE